jgi:hypothetical protein
MLVPMPAAAAPHGLSLGFFDSFAGPGGSVALDDARALGADTVRIAVNWQGVAPPSRPPNFAPADPASPDYRWAGIDAAVQHASRNHLRVLLSFDHAPRWAEGARRPNSAPQGSWRPQAPELAAFARAAAARYSGRFPDPARPGSMLPRVRFWQPWNEPNLATYVTPQWVRSGRRWKLTSPAIYRSLLNGVYRAVKGVARTNYVVSAGTAPFGDPHPGDPRVRPVLFTQALLCLGSVRDGCADPAHFDALDHHPYAVSGPRRPALNAGDVSVADIHKLTRLVAQAQRRGTALPRGRKGFWTTELSWDSRPPDPQGVPEHTRARWLEEAFFLLWRQGVGTITWFTVRDQPPVPSYSTTFQAGVLFADGRRKAGATAFAFPFIVYRSRGSYHYWLRSPASGPLTIEARVGGRWRTVRRVRASRHRVMTGSLPSMRRSMFRASVGSQHSLSWRP